MHPIRGGFGGDYLSLWNILIQWIQNQLRLFDWYEGRLERTDQYILEVGS